MVLLHPLGYFADISYLEERGTCIKRLFRPPYEAKKIKVAFHKFLLISLLEQLPKCKRLGLILFLPLLW